MHHLLKKKLSLEYNRNKWLAAFPFFIYLFIFFFALCSLKNFVDRILSWFLCLSYQGRILDVHAKLLGELNLSEEIHLANYLPEKQREKSICLIFVLTCCDVDDVTCYKGKKWN